MRFFSFLSNCLLLSSLLEAPTAVVAKSNVGQFSSVSKRPSVFQPNVNEKKVKTKSLVKQVQRAGADEASNKDAITGAVTMALIERGVNKLFALNNIKFPPMLGGCISLFFFLLMADVVSPGLGQAVFTSLSPGAALLAKWFPVMFVPGLVLLPLAPSLGSGLEVLKFLMVTVIGFIFSLTTTAYAVLFLRAAQGTLIKTPPAPPAPIEGEEGAVPAPPAKPFRDETMAFLFKATIFSAAASLAATRMGNDLATPISTIFLFFTTCVTYVWGARLPASFNKVIHPLLTSTALTIGVIRLTSMATGVDFIDMLKAYKIGSYDLLKMGAGDIMMFLLGPSVVSFAISMYSRRKLLKDNLLIVISSMLVSSIGGLFGTAAFVKAINLGGNNGLLIRLSTLSRNVTTALAMACTLILEGDISLAVTIVVLTGILGATYGRRMLDAMGIYDPVTRGLAVGGAAQGLGVSSMVSEGDAFPFAAMSMILTAICVTVLVSIPSFKDVVVSLCK